MSSMRGAAKRLTPAFYKDNDNVVVWMDTEQRWVRAQVHSTRMVAMDRRWTEFRQWKKDFETDNQIAYQLQRQLDGTDVWLDWGRGGSCALPHALAAKLMRRDDGRWVEDGDGGVERSATDRVLTALINGRNVDSYTHNPGAFISAIEKCESFLDGSEDHVSVLDIVASLPRKEHASKMMDGAGVAPEDRDGAVYLSYFVAMLMVAAIHRHGPEEGGPGLSILGGTLDDPHAALAAQAPAMLRVFLWTLASCRSHVNGLHRSTLRHLPDSPKASKDRARRLLPTVASIFGANQRKGGMTKLSSLQEYITCVLLLDREGVSDHVLAHLCQLNVCRGPRQGRQAIKRASAQLTLETVFPTGDAGSVQCLGFSFDNANIHKHGVCHNFITSSCVMLGFVLTRAQVTLVNAGLYIKAGGMRALDSTTARFMALGTKDDEILANVSEVYSILALQETAAPPATSSVPGRPTPAAGDSVSFLATQRLVEGSIVEVDETNNMCTVQWKHANGDMDTMHMHLDSVTPCCGADSEAKKKRMGLHSFLPSLSWVHEVLCNVSSKSKLAASQCLTSLRARVRDRYPLFIGVDNEFYGPLAMKFFQDGVPLIPMIAPGHLLQCITVSNFKYYEMLFVRPMLQALGYVAGRPAHGKIMKAKNISKAIKINVGIAHALRVALARRFLDAKGNELMPGLQCTFREAISMKPCEGLLLRS